ncbi:MAG: enoyl-CoA hydratase/isomerase family protein [Ilumatobacter sp.]|uniref:enoyl-CoA hydratase/isomerase family protein n=1 Tax=Ilumatobacter sp. TaxID=1967498 RepID=UPI002622BAD5|nr:enoyl-CoA hydratase/isomerase family protein [Ilumatobacter sp.]MDJ0769375.1 enoyl-CoA hydratase/isomerase family protein [Ilumatobacter sp.]
MRKPRLATIKLIHPTDAPVATLLLNRPDRLNALSAELLAEVPAACDWLTATATIKAVVVRGAGRAFSAGFDLGDFTGLDTGMSSRETADLGRLAAEALTNVRPLTVAAIHGHCVGGGLVLAAACDLRLAADDASFSIPEVDLGIPLAWGGIPRLVRELGPAITKELVLTCRPFGAAEALQLRFLNRAVPEEQLIAAAEVLAADLASKPGFALRATKTHVNAVMDEIAGVARNANDADTLVAALLDSESREASRAYLQARNR